MTTEQIDRLIGLAEQAGWVAAIFLLIATMWFAWLFYHIWAARQEQKCKEAYEEDLRWRLGLTPRKPDKDA